jgi:hypothetical protein
MSVWRHIWIISVDAIVRKVDLRIGKDVVIESKKRGDKAGI